MGKSRAWTRFGRSLSSPRSPRGRARTWPRTVAGGLVPVLLVVGAFMGCSDSGTPPEDAPEGHTVVKDGVPHAPGLNDPLASCVTCHGADLRGGDGGEPSCFACHGQKW